MALKDPSPKIKSPSFNDFFNSMEGNETVSFINEFIILNHMVRVSYSHVMQELTHEIEVETSIFNRLFPEKGERMVMKRLFQIEAISSALMTSEELSAFCLSFEGYLEDLPKKLVGYKTEDINRFYKNVINADDQYFQDLWIFPNPDTFTEIEKYERSLIEKIQDQNIRFTRKLFNEITKFRQLYGKLYNKYKHSLPLFLSFGEPEHVSAELEKDKECLEIVVVFDDPNNLLRKPRIFILARAQGEG